MQQTQARTDLLSALRAATADEHRQLEGTPVMAQLMSNSLSVEDYLRVLALFSDLYYTLDPLLAAWSVEQPGYHYEPRLPYLEQDLAAFSVTRPPQQISHLGPVSSSSALGYAYVVEGSSQGGRILYPRIQRQLNLEAKHINFFSYFANHSDGWQQLRSQLAMLSPDDSITNEVTRAATELFSTLCSQATNSESTAHPAIPPKESIHL